MVKPVCLLTMFALFSHFGSEKKKAAITWGDSGLNSSTGRYVRKSYSGSVGVKS